MNVKNTTNTKNRGDTLASEQIFNQLREEILKGNYEKGDVITEKELTDRLNFSRTPVRMALNNLEKEWLVEKRPNKNGWSINGLTQQDIDELLYIRRFCERYVVKKAAKNINSEQKAKLKMSIELTEEFVQKGDLEGVRKWSSKFNEILLESSGVSRIGNLLNRIYQYIDHISKENLKDLERATKSSMEHEMIGKAIIEGDSDKAVRLVDQHLQAVKEKFTEVYIDNA